MGYDIHADGVSQSLLRHFQLCPVRGLIATGAGENSDGQALGWQQRSMEKKTRYGSLAHDVLEPMYKESRHDSPFIVYHLNLVLDRYVEEHADELHPSVLQDVNGDAAKLHAILHMYPIHYANDFDGKIFVGSELMIDVMWNGYRLRGKIDGVFRDQNGDSWLLEHKTKGRIEEDKMMTALLRDHQNLFYVTLYEAKFQTPVKGILYNVIRNPGSNPRKDEALPLYTQRIHGDIVKNSKHFFKRYTLSYTDADKESYRNELLFKLARMERILNGRLMAYHNEAHCGDCDFPRMCLANDQGAFLKKPIHSELM